MNKIETYSKPISEEEFANLLERVDERITKRNLHGETPELSALELDKITREFFKDYYEDLCKAVIDDVKKMNKKAKKSRFLGKAIPYIASITPSVYENGDEELMITFEDNNRYRGICAVQKDGAIVFEFMHPAYSIGDTIEFLHNYQAKFDSYFKLLDNFKEENPGFAFEFGPAASEENSVQRLEDGFISVKLNLNDPYGTKTSLQGSRDAFVGSQRCPGYEGYINEEVDQFSKSIMSSFPVNEDDLNPFFKRVLQRSRNEEPGPVRRMSIPQ